MLWQGVKRMKKIKDETELEAKRHKANSVLSVYFAKEFPFLAGPSQSQQEQADKLHLLFEMIMQEGRAKRS